MSPKHNPKPAVRREPRLVAERTCDHEDSVEEALLILSRMLGRQAARDWLSADICPPETSDDA